jgi:ubiquinone/menaquinone biosynthesis C-methylase UbiE
LRILIIKIIRKFWMLIFQALYYPLAPVYDKISRYGFLGQWSKWQQAVLPRLQGKRVLEVGCGTGSLLKVLLEGQYRAFGLDASPAMLNQARHKLEKAGFKGRLVRGKVQRLPFPDNSFETVVCTFPTSYIISLESLSEIQRVLYPGGRLVVVDTAFLKPYSRASRFLIRVYGLLGVWGESGKNKNQRDRTFYLPLAEAGLVRRDEIFEDDQGEAHIIIATKVW